MFSFFATRGFKDYVKTARGVLDRNWMGAYTRPSPGLYPHQWNWDSGFIAIGNAHTHTGRSQRELVSLFSHQWPNGMVPHIVFNADALGHYFPEPDFWQVPDGRLTSGITMPPIHATACWIIYERSKNKAAATDFLRFMYPKLLSLHRYLYRERDPDATGLVTIYHPWESGLDNSPAWDKPLKRVLRDENKLPHYDRKDLRQEVSPEERPSDDAYDRYVYLVDLFRRLGYRDADIRRECPFRVQDVLFNSILCRANRDLRMMADLLHQDREEIDNWVDTTTNAISKRLWCNECKQFEPLDLVTGRLIHSATADGFMPLFGRAATQEQAQRIFETLDSVSFCALHQGNCFTIPNYDMTRDDFDSRNYWRGPVWININWMISHGLKGYGYVEKSDAMKRDIIQLPIRFGFHEYFDSRTGKGYGAGDFSWTAALFLDLVHEYYAADSRRMDWIKHLKNNRLKEKKILNDGNSGATTDAANPASDLMDMLQSLRTRFWDTHRGRVDYEALKASRDYRHYQKMAAGLRHFDLRSLSSREEKLAFWINLYNAIVIQGIIDLGITASVKEIPNFFSKMGYVIHDMPFSPDAIEHGVLRANRRPPHRLFRVFGKSDERLTFSLDKADPRVHFALVCGSRSCAPIRFYHADRIDAQLDTAARNFVNSSEVILLPEEGKIVLSQIFDWYKIDFGGKDGIRRFLLRYLETEETRSIIEARWPRMKLNYLFYDWDLNH
jgi:hypothetical protein